MYQTIVEAIQAHAVSTPDKLAVAFKKQQLTYAQLAKAVREMACILSGEYGIKKGDFVMLQGVSKPEYIVAWLAIQYLKAASVPMDRTAKEENILDVYRYAGPKLLISDYKLKAEDVVNVSLKKLYESSLEPAQERMRGSAENSYVCPEKDAVSEILFTTGTTGKPKGVMLSNGNIYASTHNTRDGVGMKAEDVVLIPLPLNHSIGMRVLRTTLYIGATVILQNGFTFARELENNINAYGCTGMVSVPASMELIYRQMQDKFAEIVGRLRYMEVGAGSLGYDMKKKLLRSIPQTKVVNTWGSTETGGAIFLNVTRYPQKLTSIGQVLDGIDFKIVGQDGEETKACDPETAGRMVLRGPMQMLGYYDMPKETAKTLVGGWLYTNDIVYRDEDGFVYMLGRADDIINVGGEKVSPVEVENIAQEFDKIRECACIGVDDPEGILGRVPVLFVVPENDEFDEADAIRYLDSRLEKYKMPHRYLLIDELPRNRMQKLDRKALAGLWQEMQ